MKNLSIKNIKWPVVNTHYFQSTISSKLRYFQYKYLNKIIATNDYLYKYNIVNSNLCDFCSMSLETNKHLFWECSKSQQFWSELGTFLNNNNIVCNLNWHLICFGQYEINSILLNFCILLGKYFIYSCKLRNTDPKFSDFKLYLKTQKI